MHATQKRADIAEAGMGGLGRQALSGGPWPHHRRARARRPCGLGEAKNGHGLPRNAPKVPATGTAVENRQIAAWSKASARCRGRTPCCLAQAPKLRLRETDAGKGAGRGISSNNRKLSGSKAPLSISILGASRGRVDQGYASVPLEEGGRALDNGFLPSWATVKRAHKAPFISTWL